MSKISNRVIRLRGAEGFTLIEFGIVMIVTGFIISALVGVYTTQMKRIKLETSYKRVYAANNLIAEAWRVDNRYFCPADPTLDRSDANYGLENCATAVAVGSCTGGTDGVCVATGQPTPRGSNVLIGMIPFKSITQALENREVDLNKELAAATDPATKEEIRRALKAAKSATSVGAADVAVDGWNNRLTYMVSAAWTESLEDNDPALRNMGSVEVWDGIEGVAGAKRAAENGVHFAVISHGANANGAYSARGRLVGTACSALRPIEQENCDKDARIVRASLNSDNTTSDTHTDDLIAYNVSAAAELWERIECDGKMCLRNRNPDNVAIAASSAPAEKLTVGGVMRAEKVRVTETGAQLCDENQANCISPDYIGGTSLNDCSTQTPTASNKKWVAKRITGSGGVPTLICEEIEMKAYNDACPAIPGGGTELIKGFEEGEIVCEDPCDEDVPDPRTATVPCPSGMSGSLSYSSSYNCANRQWLDYTQTGGTCTYNQVNSSCGSSHATNRTTTPTNGFCVVGEPMNRATLSESWTWQCAGAHGGALSNCIAHRIINGACGSSHGQELYTAPSSGLCNAGDATGVSGSGPWTWSCIGKNTGSNASCSAALACSPTSETDSASCPAGQTGSRAMRRDYECPSRTWTGWYETANSCVVDPGPPPPGCTPASDTRAASCDWGYTGSRTEQRDYECPAATWTGWYEIANSCVVDPTPPPPPPPCTPDSETQGASCPGGYSGSRTEQRDYQCPGGTWTGWYEVANNCVQDPPPPPPPVDGVCGGGGGCAVGSAGGDNGATCGTREWQCSGSNGGSTDYCSEYLGDCNVGDPCEACCAGQPNGTSMNTGWDGSNSCRPGLYVDGVNCLCSLGPCGTPPFPHCYQCGTGWCCGSDGDFACQENPE